jgi:hypothetical protein
MILAEYITFQDSDETTVGLYDRPVLMKDEIHQSICSKMDTCSVGSIWHLGNSFCIFNTHSIELMHNKMIIAKWVELGRPRFKISIQKSAVLCLLAVHHQTNVKIIPQIRP